MLKLRANFIRIERLLYYRLVRLAIHILDPPDLAALPNQVIFDDVDLVLNNLIGVCWQQESLVVE